MLPKTNARLTRIAGGGTLEDFDEQAGPDTDRWAGEVSAYVVERVLSEVASGRLDEAKKTYLIVPHGIPVELGDTVSYVFEGAATQRQVKVIERHALVGTTRLHLEDG